MNNLNIVKSLTAEEIEGVKLLRIPNERDRVGSAVIESLAKKELVQNLADNQLDFTALGEAVYDRLASAPSQRN